MMVGDVFQLSPIGRGNANDAWKIVLVGYVYHSIKQFDGHNNMPAWNGWRDSQTRNMNGNGEVISE